MIDNMKLYWGRSQQQYNTIFTKCTIVHSCLDIMAVTDMEKIQNSVCNRDQARKAFIRRNICPTDSDHGFTH